MQGYPPPAPPWQPPPSGYGSPPAPLPPKSRSLLIGAIVAGALVLLLAGIGLTIGLVFYMKKPSAREVCEALQEARVARACHTAAPDGIGAEAVEKVAFDLRSNPNKTGQVLRFKNDQDYDEAVADFKKLRMFAGPWRFGNDRARIFVQMSDSATTKEGERARKVVEDL